MMRGIFFGLMLPTLVSVAQASAGDHRAWIETSVEDDRLLAVPQIEGGHDAMLDYELISTKAGKAGRSSSTQAGSVRVGQGETRSLTRLRLSVASTDTYLLSLRVYEGGELVAEDSVSYP
jgi:hypothetical protein